MKVKLKELQDGNIFELNGAFFVVIELHSVKSAQQLTGHIPVSGTLHKIDEFEFDRFFSERIVTRYCHEDFMLKIHEGNIIAIDPAVWMN
jgi:hypothetical protein